jgi:hypothetical protein
MTPSPPRPPAPKQEAKTKMILYGQKIKTSFKGRDLEVIAMGNDGDDPSALPSPSSKRYTQRQLRAGITCLDIRDEKMEPLDAEERYEKGGTSVLLRNWLDTISMTLALFGRCHALWVWYAANGRLPEMHRQVHVDFHKISDEDVETAMVRIKDEKKFAFEDQKVAGRFILQSLGPLTQKEVLAGDRANSLLGTEILYRLFKLTEMEDVGMVDTTKKRLSKISIKNSPTLDYSSLFMEIREVIAEMCDRLPDEFVHHHFSSIIAGIVYGGDAFHKEHVPMIISAQVLQFYITFKTTKVSYTEFCLASRKITSVHGEQVRQGAWEPSINKAKTKELSMLQTITALERKVTSLLAQSGGGGGGGGDGDSTKRFSVTDKVLLEDKFYEKSVFDKFTWEEREYIRSIKRPRPSRSGGGGGGRHNPPNRSGLPPMTNAFLKPVGDEASSLRRVSKDNRGTPRVPEQFEYYCTKCKGPSPDDPGRWTSSHGDKHPSKQHQEKSQPSPPDLGQESGNLAVDSPVMSPTDASDLPIGTEDGIDLGGNGESSFMFGWNPRDFGDHDFSALGVVHDHDEDPNNTDNKNNAYCDHDGQPKGRGSRW